MDREEIIRMAREAGAYAPKYPIGPHDVQFSVASLERFFRMAQEAEADRTTLRGRLAQPEQEPVKFNCTVVDDAHPEGVPLSQWGRQPLTEAAIRNMCEHVPDYDISTHDLIQFARAIEAAHGIKEKNHG